MRRKILVLGNHDELKAFSYIEAGFESVHTSLEVNGRILIHDPAVATINPNKTFICGHVHTLFLKCSNTINVGVDQFSFMPVQESTIIDIENSGQDYFKAWEDFVKWTKK